MISKSRTSAPRFLSFVFTSAFLATSASGCSLFSSESAAAPARENGMGMTLGATSGTLPGEVPSPPANDVMKASEKEQKEFMQRQAGAMEKQEDELDDLRRQRYHDEYLRQQFQVDEAERAQ